MKSWIVFCFFCTSVFASLHFSPPHYAKPDEEVITQFPSQTQEKQSTKEKQEKQKAQDNFTQQDSQTQVEPSTEVEQNTKEKQNTQAEQKNLVAPSTSQDSNPPSQSAQDNATSPQTLDEPLDSYPLTEPLGEIEIEESLTEEMQEPPTEEIAPEEEESLSTQEVLEKAFESMDKKTIKVALMIPKKIIGRYSSISANTILSYLSTRGKDFYFEVFDCETEELQSISATYEAIAQQDFHFIIGLLTSNGANVVSTLNLKIPFYIPTTHIKDITSTDAISPFLIFGGIDYDEQIQLLASLKNDNSPIVAYNDDSQVGQRLGLILKDYLPNTIEQSINQKTAATFSSNAKAQEKLISNANVFLNTPIIKTGLLLSQIGYFRQENQPSKFLSTQLNYNPSLMILTQQRDRNQLFIANSISQTDLKLTEIASLLNSNLKYDWVNYSTALGMDLLYCLLLNEDARFFSEQLIQHQVQYLTRIYKVNQKGFYAIENPEAKELPQRTFNLPRTKSLQELDKKITQESAEEVLEESTTPQEASPQEDLTEFPLQELPQEPASQPQTPQEPTLEDLNTSPEETPLDNP